MRKIFSIICSLIFLLTPFCAFNVSAATPYFQFAPDVSTPVLFSSLTAPVVEIFKPSNEFMSGFDIWLANEGEEGSLTITLENENNTVLVNKTITVPNTPKIWGGTQFHISLGGQIPVSYNKNYYIKFESVMPSLYLYKADRVLLLEHNSEAISEPLVGHVQINSIDQVYTFKYALYETYESSAPILVNPSNTATTSTEVTVYFRANEPTDSSIVEISPNGTTDIVSFSGQYQMCVPIVKACSIIFTKPLETNNGYNLIVKDIWGNQTVYVIGELYIPPSSPITTPNNNITDTISPKISNLRVVSTTLTSASFAWTTDEPATSRVLVKLHNQLIGFSEDKTLELEHFITVSGLTAYTTYSATAVSDDASANTSYYTLSFETNNSTILPPPVLVETPVQTPPINTPTSTSTLTQTINSLTNNNSDNGNLNIPLINSSNIKASNGYRVDVLSNDWKLVNKSFASNTEALVIVKNLPVGDYNVIVYANDKGVFKKISASKIFSVAEQTLPSNPNITLLTVVGASTVLLGGGLLLYLRRKTVKVATIMAEM